MSEENPGVVLVKAGELKFEDLPIPKIEKPDECIIEIKDITVCGSDTHYYKAGELGPFKLKAPMVMGHECSGVISQVGKDVKDLKVGDRVAIEPGVVKSRADKFYKEGRYNLSPMDFAATPDPNGNNPQGALCKYYKSPADLLYKLPDNLSLELGALCEPLSVGVHGIRRSNLQPLQPVVVFGAGPVGILLAGAVRVLYGSEVLLVDIVDEKLKLAKEIGACTHTYNSKDGNVDDLIKAFDGTTPIVSYECTGAPPCIDLAVKSVETGGSVVQVGNASSPTVPFPITDFSNRELTLYGSFRYAYGDYPTSIKLLEKNYANGKEKALVDFEKLITNVFPFKDAIKAYEFAAKGKDYVKILIKGPE
ncbi:XYL2 [Candida pseudojiufengensis]|uniref:XYL2 n=1 Tax=Candida pseudojiufengensis TaxID=497109 RepID=UPI002224C328|nr:XYL2 [Candida pseudojiufengensis]KAI5961836.1 XYL2 [Candida pseudojiufengensis]